MGRQKEDGGVRELRRGREKDVVRGRVRVGGEGESEGNGKGREKERLGEGGDSE